MACELFIPYKPRSDTLAVIKQANLIVGEYLDDGFVLTLRQLFYQFVARKKLDNTQKEYRRLGSIIRTARDGGLVDWDAIEDRTREVHFHQFWESPSGIITDDAETYREDLWSEQRCRPEVWIEKEALIGIIEGICTEFRVPYFATHGNNSHTLQYQAGKRFARYLDLGRIPLVLLLTDHDPKGVDMERDVRERLALYARADIEVRRLALTTDQARRLPPNFAKEDDSSFAAYVRQFGTKECWELDALSPTVIANLIRREIEGLIEQRRWRKAIASENRSRRLLTKVARNWALVEKLMRWRGIGPWSKS
jgi:hypothetical protein